MGLKIGLVSLYVFENNGVRLLASVLRNAGYEVYEIYFKDYLHHHFVEPTEVEIGHLLDVLRKHEVGLVGFSVRAGAYLKIGRQLTEAVRKELGLPVVWGGPHVSYDRETCVRYTDFLAVGEAEDEMLDLVKALESGGDTTNIPGVWANVGGRIFRNPVRRLEENLDRIPFRDYHTHEYKFVIEGKRFETGDPVINEPIFLMLSSRGCPFNCKFCNVNISRRIYKGKGKFFRVRSVKNVIAELADAKEHFKNLVRIRFDDELFPYDSDWIREFSQRYKKEIGLPFEILSDPRVIEDEDIARLKDAGLDHVLLGIQASEEMNRELLGREQPNEQVVEVSRILARHKILGGFQIIVDIPGATRRDKSNLLNLLLGLSRPFDLYSFSLNFWPGTDLTAKFLREGTIRKEEVAGASDKVLRQFRVDSSQERPPEDRFWIALYHLTSKSFVPKALIRWMSRRPFLMRHPWPVSLLSESANFIKLGLTGLHMLLRGELSWNAFRRFFNLKAPVSI